MSFVKADRPSCSSNVRVNELLGPVYVKARHINPRISAQKGAFLLFGLNEYLKGITQESIIIPASAKPVIIRELDLFAGINQGRLFPELDKFLMHIKQCAKDGRA